MKEMKAAKVKIQTLGYLLADNPSQHEVERNHVCVCKNPNTQRERAVLQVGGSDLLIENKPRWSDPVWPCVECIQTVH